MDPSLGEIESEEACIQEVIAQFYLFIQKMVQLRNDVELEPGLDHRARDRILDQLEGIEADYKDSQEWFITRDVQDVRVGVIGTERSLKSALVSLFVEDVLEIEGDEKDGRSKSKITVDGKCKLLLIREETCYPGGDCPSKQLSQWADVLLLVFNHHDEESLASLAEFYRVFKETRDSASFTPVVLVGIKGTCLSDDLGGRVVRGEDVRRTVDLLEKCHHFDVMLNPQETYSLFAQVCRLALTTYLPLPSLSSFIPSSPSQGSISSGVGHQGGAPPPSPSHIKRLQKKKSGFGFGSTKASYAVKQQLTTVAEFGSGRSIPIKEGPINKKGAGGLRAEWKKKYLVLSQNEVTYFPRHSDYMNQTHGKTLPLQHIAVKIPGKRVASVSRTATAPSSTHSLTSSYSEHTDTDYLSNAVEHSPSVSPTPPFESSNNYTPLGHASLRITGPSPQNSPQYLRRSTHSPTSPDEFGSSENIDETMRNRFRFTEHVMNNGRGHNRNNSMDEVIMQQLRTGGISYPTPPEAELGDRSATMSRIQGRKGGRDRGRTGLLGVLSQGSEEAFLSEGTAGSSESIGRPERKKKGDKDRNSWMGDRNNGSQGDAFSLSLGGGGGMVVKDRERDKKKGGGHKRQRSWAGNKLMDAQDSQQDTEPESCEFQILSLDGKVWTFEAGSPEEATSWVKSVEDQIKKSLAESTSHKRMNSGSETEKKEIVNLEGNGFCADCNSPNPEWASLNLGCVLCIECSGVHRKLGSHISRVRSLSLDEWSPELISVMLSVGNKASRTIWESRRPRHRPIHSSPREDRERFIKAKYIDKEFLADLPLSGKPLAEQLIDSVKAEQTLNCLLLLSHTLPEDINVVHGHPDFCTPLHIASQLGNVVILQLLIWNGADVNLQDAEHRSPLFYARSEGHRDCAGILIANNCIEDGSPVSSDTGSTEVLHTSTL